MEATWTQVTERNPMARRDVERAMAFSNILEEIDSSDEDSEDDVAADVRAAREEIPLRQPSQLSGKKSKAVKEGSREADEDLEEDSDDGGEPGDAALLLAAAATGKGECQRLYEESGNCMKLLFAMCLGIKDRDTDPRRYIADIEDDKVYKLMVNKSSIIPTVDILKAEMKRRANLRGIKKFRKNSCPKSECIRWLKQNPLTNTSDIKFLRFEEKKIYDAVLAAALEGEKQKKEKLLTSNWTGPLPWLRLYCAMMCDDAMESLKDKDRCLARDELDARNSAERPETYVEVVTRIYNDQTEVFYTESLPGLHSNFSETLELKFEEMPGGKITVEDCKKKIADARVKLMTVRSFNIEVLVTLSLLSQAMLLVH